MTFSNLLKLEKGSICNIFQAFPDVIVVLHILPGPNSEEYLWMKRCARVRSYCNYRNP